MNDFLSLSPEEFEQLVGRLFEKMGMKSETTKRSHDGGVDLIVTDDRALVGGRYIVQCKRYGDTVSAGAIRDLYGVVMHERGNKGILITSGSFSSDAKSFARDKPLELIDGERLADLLAQYDLFVWKPVANDAGNDQESFVGELKSLDVDGERLEVILGRLDNGLPFRASLSEASPLLIAGAPRTGVRECLHSAVCSILFSSNPEHARLLLVDSMTSGLSQYDGIPHLLAPVADPRKAIGMLRGIVRQLELRYQEFARAGVRSASGYNQTAQEKLPSILVVVAELNDLMTVSPGDTEHALVRLAVEGPDAGIFLLVATSTPVAGVFSQNLLSVVLSRISFRMPSSSLSRLILNRDGAERLQKGQMLASLYGESGLNKANYFEVSDDDIQAICGSIREQLESDESDAYRTPKDRVALRQGSSLELGAQWEEGPRQETDPMFLEALGVVVESGQVSASLLQRRLHVGYSRATRLVDSMEERGLVGPAIGAEPRRVLIGDAELAQMLRGQEALCGAGDVAVTDRVDALPMSSGMADDTTGEAAEEGRTIRKGGFFGRLFNSGKRR